MPEIIEWLDENSLRSFPFLTNTNKTADSSYVLDNGLILDLNLIYSSSLASPAALLSINNGGASTVFNFTNSVSFTISNSLTGIQYVSGTDNSQLVINTSLLGVIPSGASNFTNLYVEPSLIHEYCNDWLGVTSLSVTPDYVSGGLEIFYAPELPLTTQSSPTMTGEIQLFEGYNFGIDFDLIGNNINLQAGDDYGIPLSCNDQFINPSLTDCESIVSYINGVPPDDNGNFTIAAGTNINLVPGSGYGTFYDGINMVEPANNHTLFIGLSLLPSDLCSALAALPAAI